MQQGEETMDILEELNDMYGMMSPIQKRIADYIFTYPEEACFLSLKDFSETLGVTEVTVLRFVKKLGLTGYVELKNQLRQHLQTRLNHGENSGLTPASAGSGWTEQDMDKGEMFGKFAENEQRVIKNTYARISLEQVMEAVSIIRQAKMVYVTGSELTSPVSYYLTRRLSTLGIRVMDLSSMTRALYSNYISHIGPEDAVVMFTTPGYAKHLVNTSRYLSKKRVAQILVTDKLSAPQAPYATTILTIDNHDLFFFNSVLGMFSVASLLAHFVALHDLEDTNRKRHQLSEAREEIGTVFAAK